MRAYWGSVYLREKGKSIGNQLATRKHVVFD